VFVLRFIANFFVLCSCYTSGVMWKAVVHSKCTCACKLCSTKPIWCMTCLFLH